MNVYIVCTRLNGPYGEPVRVCSSLELAQEYVQQKNDPDLYVERWAVDSDEYSELCEEATA